mgnify:CR=1 FL=1
MAQLDVKQLKAEIEDGKRQLNDIMGQLCQNNPQFRDLNRQITAMQSIVKQLEAPEPDPDKKPVNKASKKPSLKVAKELEEESSKGVE